MRLLHCAHAVVPLPGCHLYRPLFPGDHPAPPAHHRIVHSPCSAGQESLDGHRRLCYLIHFRYVYLFQSHFLGLVAGLYPSFLGYLCPCGTLYPASYLMLHHLLSNLYPCANKKQKNTADSCRRYFSAGDELKSSGWRKE